MPERIEYTRVAAVAVTLAAVGCSAGRELNLGPPMTLTSRGGSNPTAAVDARNGATYVAWVETHDRASNVYLARADGPSASFSAPVRVNDQPGDAAPHEQAPAQVAVGPEGNVYVVWQTTTPVEGRRFPASDLRFARSPDGGRSFGPAITVNDDAGGPPASHTFHNLAVGSDGTVYVSWLDSRGDAGLAGAIGDPGDGAAHRHAVAHADPARGPDIRVARSANGGRTFEPSVIVDSDVCPCCRTVLAVSGAGTVYVAWRKVFPGNVRDIAVARSDHGARTFTAPLRVHDDAWVFPGCPHAGPGLAVDDAGRVHTAWYTGADGAVGLYYAVADGLELGFGEPEPLIKGPVAVSQVKLAALKGGVLGAWDDRRSDRPRVMLGRAQGGSGLSDRAVPVGFGGSAAVAAAGGVYAVAWLDGESVRVRTGGYHSQPQADSH